MSSILERLRQIANEKSAGDKPTVLTREDVRKVTGITKGSDIKCYKTLLEESLQAGGINIEFAKRGSTNKRKNPEASQTEVTEDGLFIPLEELEKIEIQEGDRLSVQYKKPLTITRNGKTTYKQGTLIIEKIGGQDDRFIPSKQDEEDYLEDEEMSEEEEMLNA